MSILGEPFKPYVQDQIKVRQEQMGKSSNRGPETLAALNSKTAWVKLASGVSIDGQEGEDRLRSLSIPYNKDNKGTGLAQNYILFGGTSSNISGSNGINQRTTFGDIYQKGSYGITPMAGIESVNVEDLNRGSIKKATVEIRAHNREQLEVIDLLYLRLGYTVMLEWGNSHYTPSSDLGISRFGNYAKVGSTLIDKKDGFFNTPKNELTHSNFLGRIESLRGGYDGNYDGFLAKVTNFNWTFEKDGSYKITLKLISLGDVIESLKVNLSPSKKDIYPEPNSEEIPASNIIIEYLNQWVLQNVTNKNINNTIHIEDVDPNPYGYFISSTGKPFHLKMDYDEVIFTDAGFKEIRKKLRLDPLFQAAFKEKPNEIQFSEGGAGLLGKYEVNNGAKYLSTPLDQLDDNKNVIKRASQVILDDAMYITLKFNIKIDNPLPSTSNQKDIFYMNYATEENPNNTEEGDKRNYYIRFGKLLEVLENYCIPTNKDIKQIHINSITIPTQVYPNQISLDPKTCLISSPIIKGPSQPPIPIFPELNSFIKKDINQNEVGEGTNIYVNFSIIEREILSNMDKRGDLALYNFINSICEIINKSLGGINNLEPILEKETNTLNIIDSSLASPSIKDPQIPFQIFGYSRSQSNFIRDIDLKTEITPEYASMVTIGSTAKGYTKGMEATAFSKWNIGLIDRFQEEYTPPNKIDGEKTEDNLPAIHYNKFLTSPSQKYRTYGYSIENTSEFIYSRGFSTLKTLEIDEGSIGTNLSVGTEYYKYLTSKTYEKSSGSFASNINGFIPFNLNLTMDGLSGMVIYNKIEVDTRFLPPNYPDTLKFIIKKISHKLSGGDWETSIDTVVMPINTPTKDTKSNYSKLSLELGNQLEESTSNKFNYNIYNTKFYSTNLSKQSNGNTTSGTIKETNTNYPVLVQYSQMVTKYKNNNAKVFIAPSNYRPPSTLTSNVRKFLNIVERSYIRIKYKSKYDAPKQLRNISSVKISYDEYKKNGGELGSGGDITIELVNHLTKLQNILKKPKYKSIIPITITAGNDLFHHNEGVKKYTTGKPWKTTHTRGLGIDVGIANSEQILGPSNMLVSEALREAGFKYIIFHDGTGMHTHANIEWKK